MDISQILQTVLGTFGALSELQGDVERVKQILERIEQAAGKGDIVRVQKAIARLRAIAIKNVEALKEVVDVLGPLVPKEGVATEAKAG